ncbi:MAG: hypothetical protein KKB21_00800 [Nanoarchaeota archaeon]|nr:hypothetical protein [Nanoarchaeota archaeon]
MNEEQRKKRLRDNYNAVRDSMPGSDLHGLAEKTAYYIYLENPKRDSFVNWENAQWAIAAYFSKPFDFLGEDIDLGEDSETGGLKKRLRDIAFQTQDWHCALDTIGARASALFILYGGHICTILQSFKAHPWHPWEDYKEE